MQEDYRRELDACLTKEKVLQEEVKCVFFSELLDISLKNALQSTNRCTGRGTCRSSDYEGLYGHDATSATSEAFTSCNTAVLWSRSKD